MKEALETYLVSVPSVALASMALRLARHRVYRDASMADCILLRGRDCAGLISANAEYYQIIDRISAGEQP